MGRVGHVVEVITIIVAGTAIAAVRYKIVAFTPELLERPKVFALVIVADTEYLGVVVIIVLVGRFMFIVDHGLLESDRGMVLSRLSQHC